MFFKTRKTQIFTFVAHGVLPIFLCLAICHINFFHDIQSFSCLLSVVTFCSVWVQTVRTTGATPDVQTNCTKKIATSYIFDLVEAQTYMESFNNARAIIYSIKSSSD